MTELAAYRRRSIPSSIRLNRAKTIKSRNMKRRLCIWRTGSMRLLTRPKRDLTFFWMTSSIRSTIISTGTGSASRKCWDWRNSPSSIGRGSSSPGSRLQSKTGRILARKSPSSSMTSRQLLSRTLSSRPKTDSSQSNTSSNASKVTFPSCNNLLIRSRRKVQ